MESGTIGDRAVRNERELKCSSLHSQLYLIKVPNSVLSTEIISLANTTSGLARTPGERCEMLAASINSVLSNSDFRAVKRLRL